MTCLIPTRSTCRTTGLASKQGTTRSDHARSSPASPSTLTSSRLPWARTRCWRPTWSVAWPGRLTRPRWRGNPAWIPAGDLIRGRAALAAIRAFRKWGQVRRTRPRFCRDIDHFQAVVAHTPLPGCLTPGRRQDKRHRDVRASERPRQRGMRLRGRVSEQGTAIAANAPPTAPARSAARRGTAPSRASRRKRAGRA